MTLDAIHIDQLLVECIVGINPEERLRTQPLLVDLEMRLDLRESGKSGRISATIDYDRVSHEVAALLRFRCYRLLEMAAEETAAMLFGVHPQLVGLRVQIKKPRALEGRAGAAAVTIERRREHFVTKAETATFGEVDVLFESREAGLYLLHVEPGREIPDHRHERMRELEWTVTGELLRNGQPTLGFDAVEWPLDCVHGYRNPGEQRATLFCCDVPPFIPADEIAVERPERS